MRVLFFFLLACGGGTATSPASAPAPVPPTPAPATEPAPAPTEGHGHAASHGGIQKELDGMHVEALLLPSGVMVYLTDADNKAIPVAGWTGKAVINGPAGVSTVDLQVMGDHLHAPGKLEHGKPASVVLTLSKDGKAVSAPFESASVGLAVHDHTSIHGGQVLMWGNYHVEYLAKDGEHRVWLSDAKRIEITTGVTGTVKEGEKATPLAMDASGMLSAKSESAGSAKVLVEVTVDGQTISLPFEPAATDGHDHGAHQH